MLYLARVNEKATPHPGTKKVSQCSLNVSAGMSEKKFHKISVTRASAELVEFVRTWLLPALKKKFTTTILRLWDLSSGADWAAWHLSGGPVGPPAKWATTSNVERGSGTE